MRARLIRALGGSFYYEHTAGKVMGAAGSLLLAVHVGDLFSRDKVHGLGRGRAVRLPIYTPPQHVRRRGVFSSELCRRLPWVQHTRHGLSRRVWFHCLRVPERVHPLPVLSSVGPSS
jgi:hypothetical protein